MKKVFSLTICMSLLMANSVFALESVFVDNFALKTLDKNLKVQKHVMEQITDEFALRSLNPNLKVYKEPVVNIKDDFALNSLNSGLKIKKTQYVPIEDNLKPNVDTTKMVVYKKQVDFNITNSKAKVAPLKNYSTKKGLYEGDYIDFILVDDLNIKNTVYKKGEIIKARVETVSQNQAYGTPADLIIGNFTLPDNTVLNGQIEKQGANRAIWVYPVGYTLTCFFFIGLPIFAIRGGHVKLKPHHIYEIGI